MRILTATAAALSLLLAGCGVAAPPRPEVPAATGAPASTAAAAPADRDATTAAFLARHGLAGLTTPEVIEALDAATDDREQGPAGSVRPAELLLSDDQQEVRLPLPADAFYLAFAPYRSQTHDCYNHNLASCQGELTGQAVQVTVVDDSGATILDREVTTHANGFAGIWLPRNVKGKLTVKVAGQTASVQIATGAQDPTCLTTLKLG